MESYISDLITSLIIFGILGARLYYVVFNFDAYKNDLLSILKIWEGGIAIYGAILGGLTVIIYRSIKDKQNILKTTDIFMPGLILAQSIGRWGNFFNREAFGEYTNGLFAMKLPTDAVRPSDITDLMRRHMQYKNGTSYIQVHPTFLYESLWCLMVLFIMLLYRRHKKFDGEVFLVYLFGYGLGRVWIEGLRTDQLLFPGTSIPVSQVLAGALVIVSASLIIFWHIRQKRMENEQVVQEKEQNNRENY